MRVAGLPNRMKPKRPFIAGVLLFLSSAWCQAEGGHLNFLVYLPAVTADVDDLDARDAQNRPLLSAAAHGELVVLFRQNAAELVLRARTHFDRTGQDLMA